MPISFAELQGAFLFVNFGDPGENEAYLDRPVAQDLLREWCAKNGIEPSD
jgi:hypothetical protein